MDGITYTANVSKAADSTHVYLLSFRVRTKDQGVSSQVRLYGPSSGNAVPLSGYVSEERNFFIPVNNEWQTYTFRIDADTNAGMFTGGSVGIRFQGPMQNMKALCLDSFTLIDLSEKQGLCYVNLIENGDCSDGMLEGFKEHIDVINKYGDVSYDSTNELILVSERDWGDRPLVYTAKTSAPIDPTHTYKLSFSVKTTVAGKSGQARMYSAYGNEMFVPDSGSVDQGANINRIPVNNNWRTFTYTISPEKNSLAFHNGTIAIRFNGPAAAMPALSLDNFTLIDITPPAEKEGNLIKNGGFNSSDEATNLAGWTDSYPLSTEIVESDRVVVISERDIGYVGPAFDTGVKLDKYKAYTLSFKVRTADLDGLGYIRPYAYLADGSYIPLIPRDVSAANMYHPSLTAINGEWTTVKFDINTNVNSEFLGADSFKLIILGNPGSTSPYGYPTLFIDDVVLCETERPEDGVPNIGIIMMLLHKRREALGDSDLENWEPTNIIAGANSAAQFGNWVSGNQKLEAKKDGKTEYLTASGITVNYAGFTYNSGMTLQPGSYKFVVDLRTSVKGETTNLRLINFTDNTATLVKANNTWQTATFRFTVATPTEFSLKICGGPSPNDVQNYDIANITLVKVG